LTGTPSATQKHQKPHKQNSTFGTTELAEKVFRNCEAVDFRDLHCRTAKNVEKKLTQPQNFVVDVALP